MRLVCWQELPGPILDDPGDVTKGNTTEQSENMKIAWRYQHLPASQVHSCLRFWKFMTALIEISNNYIYKFGFLHVHPTKFCD